MSVPFDLRGKRVWVAGHRGMVGSAIIRRLQTEDCTLLLASRDQVDLRRQDAVERWVADARPDVVFIAAATVGGIHANATRPVDFLYDNLMIAANIIHASARCSVRKLLFLSSSCAYPRLAPQPMTESMLLTGALEPTNEPYAIAKIAGIKLCEAYRRQERCDFISAMPANLFGPGDNFDLDQGHVIPGMMMRMHLAKQRGAAQVAIWGAGTALREFLYVDDLADALVLLMRQYSGERHVNVGTGLEISIADLARMIAEVVGYEGKLGFDLGKPGGTPRKLLDIEFIRSLGWKPQTRLRNGLMATYKWLVGSLHEAKEVRGAPSGVEG